MTEWWNALDMFQKVLYCVAIPSTLILVIQTILVLFGIGHGGEGVNYSDTSGIDFDSDALSGGFHDAGGFDAGSMDVPDFNGHEVLNHDAIGHEAMNHDMNADSVSHEGTNLADAGSLRIFTIQTVMAFLCVFGWTASVMYASDGSSLKASAVGFIFGAAAMYLIAKLAQQTAKLTANGTFNPKNAIGAEGSVYIPIPANSSGNGKINIVVQGSLMECDAMTEEHEQLSTGTKIRVTDIVGDVLVVERA